MSTLTGAQVDKILELDDVDLLRAYAHLNAVSYADLSAVEQQAQELMRDEILERMSGSLPASIKKEI